jgi:hypothetical protein
MFEIRPTKQSQTPEIIYNVKHQFGFKNLRATAAETNFPEKAQKLTLMKQKRCSENKMYLFI